MCNLRAHHMATGGGLEVCHKLDGCAYETSFQFTTEVIHKLLLRHPLNNRLYLKIEWIGEAGGDLAVSPFRVSLQPPISHVSRGATTDRMRSSRKSGSCRCLLRTVCWAQAFPPSFDRRETPPMMASFALERTPSSLGEEEGPATQQLSSSLGSVKISFSEMTQRNRIYWPALSHWTQRFKLAAAIDKQFPKQSGQGVS